MTPQQQTIYDQIRNSTFARTIGGLNRDTGIPTASIRRTLQELSRLTRRPGEPLVLTQSRTGFGTELEFRLVAA